MRSPRILRLAILAAAVLIAGALLYEGGRYLWREKRWNWIVVHHTASDFGNLAYFRDLHQREKGWPDIAYHFLINNGTAGTAAGQVEESNLWHDRDGGYSTKVHEVNQFGIAIVLVGNFEKHSVPDQQMEALLHLILRLKREHGIPLDHIVGHRELWATACPGKHLNMSEVRAKIAEMEKNDAHR